MTKADEVKEVLTKARAKVAQGWTQNTTALDAAGEPVNADSEAAVFWCALGAIWASCERNQALESDAEDALSAALFKAVEDPFDQVAEWNDAPERTQAEVLAAFDRAIAS